MYRLGLKRHHRSADGRNDRDASANELLSKARQTIVMVVCAKINEVHVGARHKRRLLQPAMKAVELIGPQLFFAAIENANHRHRRLLAARGKRKSDGRTTKEAEELSALHSITTSAVASSVGDMSRPRALAVLRLITSSNLVGCITGRSVGLSPLSMRPA